MLGAAGLGQRAAACPLLLLLLLLLTLLPTSGRAQYVFLKFPREVDHRRLLGVEADFGGSLPSQGVPNIEIVVADPENACGELVDKDYGEKLVIVRRGDCDFVDKFRRVQAAGAYGLVVSNTEQALFRMSAGAEDTSDLSIFGLMVDRRAGDRLRELEGETVSLRTYKRPIWDAAGAFLALLATLTLAGGAWWAAGSWRRRYLKALTRALRVAGLYSQAAAGISALSSAEEAQLAAEERQQLLDSVELNANAAVGFVAVASLGLLLLFYFVAKLVWVLLVLYALGGAQALASCLLAVAKLSAAGRRHVLRQRLSIAWVPGIQHLVAPDLEPSHSLQLLSDQRLPEPGQDGVPRRRSPRGNGGGDQQLGDRQLLAAGLESSSSDAEPLEPQQQHRTRGPAYSVSKLWTALYLGSLGLAVWWLAARHSSYAWVFQNVFGVCLLLEIQRLLRLPDIRVSTILLVLAFVYDIFWVFISPAIFSSSVMVTVATGGDSGERLPMLLLWPRLQDDLGGYSLLGLGDIALPGLFVSYMLRFDLRRRLRRLQAHPSQTPRADRRQQAPFYQQTEKLRDRRIREASLADAGLSIESDITSNHNGGSPIPPQWFGDELKQSPVITAATASLELGRAHRSPRDPGDSGTAEEDGTRGADDLEDEDTELDEAELWSPADRARLRKEASPSACLGGYRWWSTEGYFPLALLGYVLGLLVTNLALAATGQGQPALLYLVPGTLGLVVAMAWWRGDLREMWFSRLDENAEYSQQRHRQLADGV